MKKREIKRKLHNGILWLISYSAFILLLLSIASIMADSWFPPVAFIVSIVWLSLFALVNKDRW